VATVPVRPSLGVVLTAVTPSANGDSVVLAALEENLVGSSSGTVTSIEISGVVVFV
jgi:hypothetical protein